MSHSPIPQTLRTMRKLILLVLGLITLNPASLEAQNTPPSFTGGPNVAVSEDSGPTLIPWATGIDPSTPPGIPCETHQMVSFIVSNDNPSLFSAQPAVSAAGTLSFTPAPDTCGSANVIVVARDDGGSDGTCTPEGRATSAPVAISIDVVCTSNNCPTASATVSPTFVTTNQTNVVIAANSSNACVELDSSLSSDPDGDALTFRWFEPPDAVPFASGAVANGCFDLGTHHIVLTVNDGSCTATSPLVVVVISPCDTVHTLIALVEGSSLSPNRTRPLIATLAAACAAFEDGRSIPGIKQLQAFQNKVQSQVAPSAPALAQQLTAIAQAIIDALSGP